MLNSETILVSPLCKNITLENHVIGYKEEGESTVVFLKQDDSVILSMVIDSYQNTANETIELLKNNSVNKIDYLVWTHPHKDHSEGIEILLTEFCNNNTKVIIPNIDTSNFGDIPDNCKDKYTNFSKINQNGKRKYGELIFGEYNKVIKNYNFTWNGEKIDFRICCLSPTSKLLSNAKFNKYSSINDYSVALVIIFNSLVFVYGADIENKAINSLLQNDVFLDNVVFIKAPHHGSHSTSNFFDIVNIKEDTVCTITNYINGDIVLPEKNILDEYDARSKEVYLFNNDIESEGFGIVSSSFSLYDIKNMIYDVNTSGLAYRYCNEK